MKRRAFSSLFSGGEPFDWPVFLKRLPFQPVPVWLALSAVSTPATKALLFVSGAACTGRLRALTLTFASVVYALLFPPAAASLWYVLFGRRRLAQSAHRRIGDVTLALLLLVASVNAVRFALVVREDWMRLRPGLSAMRGACWP